jgi:DNA-binding transcriptional regulator YiaG
MPADSGTVVPAMTTAAPSKKKKPKKTTADPVFRMNFRRLRDETGLTHDRIATALGVSSGAVQKWSKGHIPDGRNLVSLAALFGVHPAELIGNKLRPLTPA